MESQSPEIKSSPYSSPQHNFGSSIILLTNPENEIYKMELTFRGQQLDLDGNPVDVGEPLMNEKGIASVIGTVQSVVNQVTVMSNLSKQEVPALMDFLGDTLAKDLMVNRVTYNITNPAARDKIYFTSLTTAYVTLKRAFEEGDKRFWKGSVQEITTKVENAQKKGGILSAFNPWK
jgi:hypothetical protein